MKWIHFLKITGAILMSAGTCIFSVAAQELKLWEQEFQPGEFVPTMETYLLEDNAPHGLVVVLPGGGYGMRAEHEGKPIAEKFNQLGFHAVVVQYRVAPNRYPLPQMDALRAIQIVRENADAWRVKPDKIAILGFSAGGHLAASTGVIGKEIDLKNGSTVSASPNAMILCYPVISGEEYGHKGSFLNLFGPDCSAETIHKFSLQHRVTADTPPTFLWHTSSDEGVPVENSLFFAEALSKHAVPFEMHIFPRGPHGIGLAPSYPEVAVWPQLAAVWLRNMEF